MVFDHAVNNSIVPYNTAKTVSTKVLKCKIVSNKDKVYTPEEQAKAGVDLSTIQYSSGHKCKSTTLHYIRNASNGGISDEKWEKVFG